MPRVVVNVSEAKAKLSKLIDMVYHGESVTIAKNSLSSTWFPTARRGDARTESEDLNELFYVSSVNARCSAL